MNTHKEAHPVVSVPPHCRPIPQAGRVFDNRRVGTPSGDRYYPGGVSRMEGLRWRKTSGGSAEWLGSRDR